MNERKAGLMAVIMIIGCIAIAGAAIADDDERGERGEHKRGGLLGRRLDVAPVTNAVYTKECGSCHFAYQPGLLPARSWKKMMGTLDKHFGDNAELDAETQKALTAYLVANSAETSNYKVSVKILNSIKGDDAPLAISKTAYFTRKHREVPARMVKDNAQVKSFAACGKCHTAADKGSYNEHEVNIPGFGKFED